VKICRVWFVHSPRGCAFLLLIILGYTSAAQAQTLLPPCAESVGKLASMQGTVAIQRTGSPDWHPASPDLPLCENDTIRVGRYSRAAVSLINDGILRLEQNTTLRLTDVAEKAEDASVLDLIVGIIQSFSQQPHKFAVNTPYLNGSIEGTEFVMRSDSGESTLIVLEGKVLARNEKGELAVGPGESASAESGKAPTLTVLVKPRDAVHWALYYPPVLAAYGEAPAPQLPGFVHQAMEQLRRGDTSAAFAVLDKAPPNEKTEPYYLFRAALLLSVGRVNEANGAIERAFVMNPDSSNARALQAIIAVTKNEKRKALELARKALAAAPDSATALIALSYAQQARFDLEGARATLEKALAANPNSALAWARLAAVRSAFGEIEEALEAAHKAAALAPELSLTQTILGFAYLTEVDTERAREAFDKAIALDQADPLPRLGLGLTKIREGDLYDGARDMEMAVALDPNRSIFRSYLGKTYYEEKRGAALIGREYETAEELDPHDPTPYFYSAIEKQTTNRPVEALEDMQKAIELNDNRAIYRSRLLLDSDLAARSASIGRIYTDLGFQQLGLVEGWKSVNTDPSSFSAHRFLADTYSALPRHQVARVSELLQSQLLQPLNMTPIQPRLAESNLFLLSALGPTALSFNEFNPIFNRDGFTVQASGVAGENSTYGGEGVIAGIYKKVSFSAGYSHFQTDGVRENNDQTDKIADALVQVELSPTTSIQAEFRHREVDRGDTQTRFLPEDISRTARFERDSKLVRLGGRYTISPSSVLLVSAVYSKFDLSLRDDQFPSFSFGLIDFTQLVPSESVGGEVQHIFRSRYFDLTGGAGYFDVDSEIALNLKGSIPPPEGPGPFEVDSFTDAALGHFNAYLYGQIKPLSNLTATLGASYDTISGDSAFVPDGGNTDQFNPKFGVIWNPIPATTVRAAAFRVFKRTLVSEQTLEPTQVAGFNQFFDDYNATDVWRYGIGIDQKFTRQLFGGAEFSTRELEVPIIEFVGQTDQPMTFNARGDEYLSRVYLNWAPHPWWVASANYFYERFKNDEALGFGEVPVSLKTHRIPLGVKFFHPSGLSVGFSSTYVRQEGEFLPQGTFDIQTGSDTFWLFDAAVSYRLPKRYGFISLGIENITDEGFRYFEVDHENQIINPGRSIVGRMTFAFP
jgi:tetratricopeptide (TPR) repeat protein